jgi:DNA-binding transcriptional regulator YdaS (Cro superfamily)
MQTLSDFIASHQPPRTDQEWADVLGVSRSHFNMLRHGKAQPSKRLMVQIERVTGGAVPVAVWFREHRGAA